MKKISTNLKKLILICLENIKGLSKGSNIDKVLPICDDVFDIRMQEEKIIVKYKGEVLGNIWSEDDCYSNLEILRLITQPYGIKYEDEGILELLKYKNKIILMLI